MTNEETTIAQHEAGLAEAQKAQVAATKAVEKARNADVAELVDAVNKLEAANVAVTRAENGLKAARFAETAEERNGLTTATHDTTKASIDFAAYDRVGVETLTIKVNIAEQTVDVIPAGAQLKAPRASKGGGTGFKSAGGVRVNGTEYRSVNAAYVALRTEAGELNEHGEVTPANTETAMRWLTKPERGYTVETIPA